MNKSRNRKFTQRLKFKYRFVVLKEDSLEAKSSFVLSRFSMILYSSIFILVVIAGLFAIIIFTPVKEYIPGYADFDTRKAMTNLVLKADSLEEQLYIKDKYFSNIHKILMDDVEDYTKFQQKEFDTTNVTKEIDLFARSREDSLLRKEFEEDDQYNVFYQENKSNDGILKDIMFFLPLTGVITEVFDKETKHYAVDLATTDNTGVKATLDGVVIFSGWNTKTGYVIILQHNNNLISVYKHNSVLLKKVGNFARAGEVIAIVGGTGELSTGPHLHFELWYDGNPLNPEDYLVF